MHKSSPKSGQIKKEKGEREMNGFKVFLKKGRWVVKKPDGTLARTYPKGELFSTSDRDLAVRVKMGLARELDDVEYVVFKDRDLAITK